MPLYNTAPPSAGNNNSINSITPSYGIRDFLLTKNLVFPAPYNLISMSLNGSPKPGQPVLDTVVGSGNVVVPIGLPLQTYGIQWKDENVSVNDFQNTESTANDLTQIDYIIPIDNPDFQNAIWPSGSEYPTTANPDVNENYGILPKTNEAQYRKDNTIKNLYLDASKQIDVADFIGLTPLDISQQVKGYLDTYGGLNLGGSADIQALDKAGSILNGQGLGFAKAGIVTNFDVRSSLVGRVLGATGLINDTKLGLIGGQQLALSLANNAAFNLQEDILGSLNIQDNVLSLVKGEGFAGLRPSYKITVPGGTTGRVVDYTARVLGFTLPRSYMTEDGSLFQAENGGIDNIERANALIKTTGKGQVQALIENILANLNGTSDGGVDYPGDSTFRSGYAPAFNNNKGEPAITNGQLYAFNKGGDIIDPLSSQDNIIPDLNFLREEKVSDSGFKSPEQIEFLGFPNNNYGYDERTVKSISFSWGTEEGGLANSSTEGFEYNDSFKTRGDKKSLLSKTQKLFNSKGMLNIVSRKGQMGKTSTQIETANGGGFSKGNAVLSKKSFDLNNGTVQTSFKEPEDAYCRSWTTYDRYDKVNKLVRHRGLDDAPTMPFRHQIGPSVLDDNGFVKIAPYSDDKPSDPKRYMFSIENLAWADNVDNLPRCERGPGDKLTGKRGRIMWFPPYDLNVTENNSVNWESSNFIGRGEPIYTYNNTERSGTLSFKVIIDHPNYINSFRTLTDGPDDHFVNSFWAGCVDPADTNFGKKLTVTEISKIETRDLTIPQEKNLTKEVGLPPLNIYFSNDNTKINESYENGLSGSSKTQYIDYTNDDTGAGWGLKDGSVATITKKNVNGITKTWADRYNFGLNYSDKNSNCKNTSIIQLPIPFNTEIRGFFDENRVPILGDYLVNTCPHCVVKVKGFASAQGTPGSNLELANTRAKVVYDRLVKELTPYYQAAGYSTDKINKRIVNLGGEERPQSDGCQKQTTKNPNPPTDTLACKKDRYTKITFEYDAQLKADETVQPDPIIKKQNVKLDTTITKKFYTECSYFDKLKQTDSFIFDKFREKIKYFHPAFHSTTPEGLNSRLTFLLQCTRQGPTLEEQGADNLAFGRPPVCILRVGDFYHTKIVIDNIGIDYEPLVWDLNPEGVGVQPMIANINMSFKFIGASSLYGPINKLQNALSFNYFANTHVYDPRADYISRSTNNPSGAAQASGPTASVTDSKDKSGVSNIKSINVGAYNYTLNKGVEDASGDEVVTKEQIIDNTPEFDQQKANENTLASEPVENNAPSANVTDCQVLQFFNINSIGNYFNGDDSIDMMFKWEPSKDVQNLQLQNSNVIHVYLISGSTNNSTEIAQFYIDPNGTNNGVNIRNDFTNDETQVVANGESKIFGYQVPLLEANDDESAIFQNIKSKLKEASTSNGNSIMLSFCNSKRYFGFKNK